MVEIIKTIDELIQDEIAEWRKLGVEDPAAQGVLSPNLFLESVKLRSIIQLLMEAGFITQGGLEQSYKKAMLESLQEARGGIMEMRKQALGVPTMVIPRTKIQ